MPKHVADPQHEPSKRQKSLDNSCLVPDGRAREVLQRVFGMEGFRGKQEEAIAAALAGQDCFVLMPTGGGKSMCYTIPAIVTSRTVVVVSPLIALMQDQVWNLHGRGVSAAFLSSSQKAAERQAVLASLQAAQQHQNAPAAPLLLYVTPELLATSFMSTLAAMHRRGALLCVAVDEAHCISSWGHDFRPAYRQLSALRGRLPGLPIMALTATADARVQADIVQQLRMRPDCLKLLASFNRPNISYRVILLDVLSADRDEARGGAGGRVQGCSRAESDERVAEAAYEVVVELVHEAVYGDGGRGARGGGSARGGGQRVAGGGGGGGAAAVAAAAQRAGTKHGAAIVYVHKRDDAERVAARLRGDGFRAASYSAKVKQAARGEVVRQWQAQQLDVVVATVAFGMGIDRGDVRLVIHHNLPKSVEGFFQESGRAGRDGLPAQSVLLYSLRDRSKMDYLLDQHQKEKRGGPKGRSKGQGEENGDEEGGGGRGASSRARAAFGEVVRYCTGDGCRRAFLLAHFGEKLAASAGGGAAGCGGCDACLQPGEVAEGLQRLREVEERRRAAPAWGWGGGPGGGQWRGRGGRWGGDAEGGWDLDSGEEEGGSEPGSSEGEQEEGGGREAAEAAGRVGGPGAGRRSSGDGSSGGSGGEGGGDGAQRYLAGMEREEREFERQRLRQQRRDAAGDPLAARLAARGQAAGQGGQRPAGGAASTAGGAAAAGTSTLSAAAGCGAVLASALKGNSALAGLPEGLVGRVAGLLEAGLAKDGAGLSRQLQKGRVVALLGRCKQVESVYALPEVLEACNKEMSGGGSGPTAATTQGQGQGGGVSAAAGPAGQQQQQSLAEELLVAEVRSIHAQWQAQAGGVAGSAGPAALERRLQALKGAHIRRSLLQQQGAASGGSGGGKSEMLKQMMRMARGEGAGKEGGPRAGAGAEGSWVREAAAQVLESWKAQAKAA